MATNTFIAALSESDIAQVSQLVQQVTSGQGSPEDQRRWSQELFEIQKRPEAYGLVVPFLEHSDPNVQFFGAHTIQVKIARDWESFPQDQAEDFRNFLLDLTSRSVAVGRSKIVLRKLFVSLCSLALKLVPGHPTQWPDWIMACVAMFSGRGASTEHILDFLSIAVEEFSSAELLKSSQAQIKQSLKDATPMVVQAITNTLVNRTSPRDMESAFRCLEAWSSTLTSSAITPLIPMLISFLVIPADDDLDADDPAFISASNALQEIMIKSPMADGSGTKSLTEPLLVWLDAQGGRIVASSLRSGVVHSVSRSLCKLLVAIGDHSTSYLAANIASTTTVASGQVQGHLVQTFLKAMLSYTALPGYWGVDEEESELTLGFWYLFQEALWSLDFNEEEEEEVFGELRRNQDNAHMVVAKAVYSELVQVLRRKVMYPPTNTGWAKDQEDKFKVYRRDIGDTLINAFYVLRNDMIAYYVNELAENLAARQLNQGWEDVEATLHCIMSIQEAMPLEYNPDLGRLFSPQILGQLPSVNQIPVRRTALSLIGTYATWFTTTTTTEFGSTASSPPLLMTAVGYVVTALSEPLLSFQAANALRDLCDANRTALAPHISAFGELHAGLTGVPATEKSKILQSIASVIEALPPFEEIPAVEAIVDPVVEKLMEALMTSSNLPDDTRALTISQLETLTSVAKGLTGTNDPLLTLQESSPVLENQMVQAREDVRMVTLREKMLASVRTVVDVWSTDASVANALSDFFKAITCLPTEMTLISLPPGPILQLVCVAAQRKLTAVWLSLAGILVGQLDPPPVVLTKRREPSPEAESMAGTILPALLQASLQVLGQPGAMEENPDVVQDFFGCMNSWARFFIQVFYHLPPGALDALMQCSISGLGLQERYSFVAACTFLATLLNQTFLRPSLVSYQSNLLNTHGKTIMRSILLGVAGHTPRSAIANLVDLLATLLTRFPAECRIWTPEIVLGPDLSGCKAGEEDRRKFIKGLERFAVSVFDFAQGFDEAYRS